MFQDHDKIKLILCLLNTTKTSIIRSSLIQLFPFYPWLKVGNFVKHFLQRKWFFHVHYLLIFQIQCQECFFQLTVARYSFSRSIPPKFERKLRRHKQGFGKIDTTVVLDKEENWLWSGLQWHRSCHSNEMTPLPILLAAVFLGTGNCSSKTVYWSFYLR